MKILIATDGKKHSEDAVKFAGELFLVARPKITVIHVHPTDRLPEETLKQAKNYLSKAGHILDNYNLEVSKAVIKQGNIVKELLNECQAGQYDLLVIGSERLSSVITELSGSLLEDVHSELAQRLKISLLVVKNLPVEIREVLLCTDGSKVAESAIEFWGGLKKKKEPHVTVLNIIPKAFVRFSDELERYKKDFLKILTTFGGPRVEVANRGRLILKKFGIDASVMLREKQYAYQEILQEEKDNDYDLIVMGYRGKNYRGKNSPGSQSLEVVRRSIGSVLIYKSPGSKKSSN